MKRVLVIHGHPNAESFGTALAEEYLSGATDAGHETRRLAVRDMAFDPILRDPTSRNESGDDDEAVLNARNAIEWAEHVAIQFPVWWAATPALLKGFIDRVFTHGWAYRYHDKSTKWDRLLAGRSARLIVTMDAPVFWDTFVYFASARRAVATGTLAFCGFAPVRSTCFGKVRYSTPEQRSAWLAQVRQLGVQAR